MLERNEPFDEELVFPGLDEKVRTRLGTSECFIRITK